MTLVPDAATSAISADIVSEPSLPLVSILIVTFNPDERSLERCLASIAQQTISDYEIVVVDNGSRDPVFTRVVQQVRARTRGSTRTAVRRLASNTGFAHAMNVAIAASSGALCLLLNPDAELTKTALAALTDQATSNPDLVGFAPKVKLAAFPDVVDSVGLEFSWSGDASQRGLGQVDIGQFDRPERVRGVSMGAALIRRAAFSPEEVGPLDERFFMFFEDVDWSLRASLYGERFVTVPQAVIFHAGGESARRKAFNWRYRLIERNVYYSAIKNYETRHLCGFLLRRTVPHLAQIFRGVRPLTTTRLLLEAGVGLSKMQGTRKVIQGRRRLRDADVVGEEVPEPAIDVETWRPIYSWRVVRDSLGRLYAVEGAEQWSRAYRYLEVYLRSNLQLDSAQVLRRLEGVAGPLPPAIYSYAENIGRA